MGGEIEQAAILGRIGQGFQPVDDLRRVGPQNRLLGIAFGPKGKLKDVVGREAPGGQRLDQIAAGVVEYLGVRAAVGVIITRDDDRSPIGEGPGHRSRRGQGQAGRQKQTNQNPDRPGDQVGPHRARYFL